MMYLKVVFDKDPYNEWGLLEELKLNIEDEYANGAYDGHKPLVTIVDDENE